MASLLKKRRLPMAVLRIAALQGLVVQSLAPQEHMKQSSYFARKQTGTLNKDCQATQGCLEPKANVPSPSEHGWTEEHGKLNILWMRLAPAPEVVLELLACKCSRVCKLPDCACLVNGLTCTDMCKLQTCTNQAVQQQEPDLELDSENSEDE
ncbi:hypothetical protein GWK47_017301 [Chionoecetes opilio]|uniref:Tesmin/TSO1-like CXC domain-containing protein n=1 Tax=Chionoecetes opilio TaxID=41210 RepID=A0A8J4XR07_CHIOP|nr:hypothetical protein GWK47_017301 [Chionoecetes opilio]